MCSCAPLPHPPFKPAAAPHPNLNPKPNAASAHRPTLLRCALVARAAARDDPLPAPSSFDFLALKRELEEQEEAVVAVDAAEGGGDEVVNEEDGGREPKRIGSSGRRTGRQMARRSGLLAKQVITVSSARSLGFVSQLWVDASSGIWGTQNMQGPGEQMGEYNRYGRRRASRSVKRQNRQGKPMGRKLHRKTRDPEDEWELPMEY